MASVSDVAESEPPAAGRPVGGYSEAELTKAFEVIRHQAMILRARSRVAAAALGVPPEEFEPEPPRLRAVGSDARQLELEAEAAALRDTQAALDQRAKDLAAREETIARAQADVDAARHELAKQLSVLEGQAEDAEATRRRYERLYEELAPRDAAMAVRERELAQLAARLDAELLAEQNAQALVDA